MRDVRQGYMNRGKIVINFQLPRVKKREMLIKIPKNWKYKAFFHLRSGLNHISLYILMCKGCESGVQEYWEKGSSFSSYKKKKNINKK